MSMQEIREIRDLTQKPGNGFIAIEAPDGTWTITDKSYSPVSKSGLSSDEALEFLKKRMDPKWQNA